MTDHVKKVLDTMPWWARLLQWWLKGKGWSVRQEFRVFRSLVDCRDTAVAYSGPYDTYAVAAGLAEKWTHEACTNPHHTGCVFHVRRNIKFVPVEFRV